MVDLISVNKFYRGKAVRYNQKNEKIEWKKPEVKTYGDAVEIICAGYTGPLSDTKDYGSDDGHAYGGSTIGS